MGNRCKLEAKRHEAKGQNSQSMTRKPCCSKTRRSPEDRVLFLQQTLGNQVVQRLIKSGVLHAKLRIGAPGDVYEQEADRVAEQVMKMPEPQAVSNGTPHIQKACPKCKDDELRRQPIKEEEEEELQAKATSGSISEVNPDIESNIQSLKGGGKPLSENDRAFFEPRFGHDFGQVRLHTDTRAAEMARAVNALAFTMGRDVAFGAGQYAPQTGAGSKLLAHELTHVVQQGSASSLETAGNKSRPLTVSSSQGALEVEAHRMAESYNWHEPPVGGLSHRILQRQPAPPAASAVPAAPRVCPVTAITPYGPPDRPPVGNEGMTEATITAMTCLENAVTAAGGTMHVSTRYRSQAYQDHLVEVWDKVNAPAHPEPECAAVMQNYATERATHFPMGPPARGVSNHTNGTAFDATVTLPAGANLDTIQAGCNLTRPVPGEPWHFET